MTASRSWRFLSSSGRTKSETLKSLAKFLSFVFYLSKPSWAGLCLAFVGLCWLPIDKSMRSSYLLFFLLEWDVKPGGLLHNEHWQSPTINENCRWDCIFPAVLLPLIKPTLITLVNLLITLFPFRLLYKTVFRHFKDGYLKDMWLRSVPNHWNQQQTSKSSGPVILRLDFWVQLCLRDKSAGRWPVIATCITAKNKVMQMEMRQVIHWTLRKTTLPALTQY